MPTAILWSVRKLAHWLVNFIKICYARICNKVLHLGLSVTYNVGGKEYLDYPQMAAVRVIVHDQNETVFPDVMGFNVPKGYQSSTAMSRVRIQNYID